MKIKIGDIVRLKSKHHQKKTFEIVFVDGDRITCLYDKGDIRRHYRVIVTADRIKSVER